MQLGRGGWTSLDRPEYCRISETQWHLNLLHVRVCVCACVSVCNDGIISSRQETVAAAGGAGGERRIVRRELKALIMT